MTLTFWDTVRGTRLADVLTRELPKLTAEKKQYTKCCHRDRLCDVVEKEIAEGHTFYSVIDPGREYCFVTAVFWK